MRHVLRAVFSLVVMLALCVAAVAQQPDKCKPIPAPTNAVQAQPTKPTAAGPATKDSKAFPLRKEQSDKLLQFLNLRAAKQQEVGLLDEAIALIVSAVMRELGLDPAKWTLSFNKETNLLEVVQITEAK
jgi:hypothetical protein